MSRARFLDVRLSSIVDIDMNQTRVAVWDNVICRHKSSPLVSTWSTRRCARGLFLVNFLIDFY